MKNKQILKSMKENALLDYALERKSLSLDQIDVIFNKGIELLSQTDLVTNLSEGGSALFPHTYISKCGDQIAAVVHACLDACEKTGKNQILLIGVLHSLTEPLIEARKKEMAGIDIFNDKCRGIFGSGLPNEELLNKEFSLDNFVFLLEHAAKKSGKKIPQVIIRYPNLLYGHPESISDIVELKKEVAKSIVVATSDLCHHGTAYGLKEGEAFPISQEGYDFAYHVIEDNLRLLSGDDLLSYRQYCINTLSDSLEVGQLLNYLLGPLEGYIRNLRLVDVSDLFEETPQSSWVAATLVELKSGLPTSHNM
jgi:predicted class III extradiol MEMO1 family dioxygenase